MTGLEFSVRRYFGLLPPFGLALSVVSLKQTSGEIHRYSTTSCKERRAVKWLNQLDLTTIRLEIDICISTFFGYNLEKWWQITQTFYMKHIYQNACAGAVFHGSTANFSGRRLDLERKIGKIVVSSGRVVQDLKCLLRDGDLHA